MFDLLLAKFKEASTWRGIAIVLGAFGVYVAPELIDTIALAAGGVVGVIEILRADSNESPIKTQVP